MKTGKRFLLLSLLLLAALTVCGCADKGPGFTLDPQELYRLPELPDKYTELNTQLNAILEKGAEYAAPASGSNIQPVQMWDLDGDGREEALAFFRSSADEKPLKIYIYKAQDEAYTQTAVIEGSGTAIHSIAYQDLDGDGRTELMVGWRVSADLLALSVYDLRPDGPTEILRTNYMRYSVQNLNDDPARELVVLRTNEYGFGVADYYDWSEGHLGLQSTTAISMNMAELTQQGRVTPARLRGKVPAVVLTGVEIGAENATRVVYDVLTVRQGELINVVLSDVTGFSTQITPFCGLYPTDINGDGITEAPFPMDTDADMGPGEAIHFLEWRSYDAEGKTKTAMRSYHNAEDGWYLQLPAAWNGKIRAVRTVQTDEASVTFCIRGKTAEKDQPFLRITAITGSNRMVKAVRGGRFNLSRQNDTVYVAELLEANARWADGISEDEVRVAFSLIKPEWTTGEN